MKNRYFSLIKNESTKEADLNIFGDITSWEWLESDISSYTLSKQLQELGDVDTINVHISSYGGEVKEGLAIYNALKNHKAKIKTYCDGFACSIASVIFMAGDERIMPKSSLLMIHNAWTYASGNANDLRKQADDLDKITSASINAYMEHINISEKELKKLLDNETWLDYSEAFEMGFATSVIGDTETDKASQSVKKSLIKMILEKEEDKKKKCESDEDKQKTESEPKEEIKQFICLECGYIYEGDELPEDFVCPECGATADEFKELDDTETDDPETDNKEEKEVTEKIVTFFNTISKIGGEIK